MAEEQLELAIETLTAAEDAATAVHETRKAIKRLRAIDRLLRSTLTEKRRRRRRKALQGAAQALAGARDAEVLLATLEETVASDARRLARRQGVRRLRAALTDERAKQRRELEAPPYAGVDAALVALSRLEEAPHPGSKRAARKAIARELASIYAEGRDAMARARRREAVADMHEWRKRVKDLRYAAEALTAASSEDPRARTIRQLAERADRLGEVLGDEHDLAMLEIRVKAERKLFAGDRKGRKALLRAVNRREKRLRRRAWKLGEKLYRERPKRLRRQLRC